MKSIVNKNNYSVQPKLPPGHQEPLEAIKGKPDREIWMAFDKGDELAFNFIYRTYVKRMFHYGSQITKDGELIKDCVQNIFIYLRRRRGSLGEILCIKAYLFKILTREIVKNLRVEKLSETRYDDMNEQFFPISICPESILIQRESDLANKEMVREALEKLTARQRQAILLLYEEGMSYKEVAETMEFTDVKSARKIVYRAMATLKEIFVDQK
ncbi:sigma-70 family RNA polymerase sigma factor [uncultured Cyclobacterium sp.]|uniref:RNA polymerase sigma factor n=1 Tax=uncultured Cyclobacterium sp. TaxID=453820 RepID=UPI0030EDD3D4|tara:strand:- start:34103 stop:34741 length:639 start_codon:yes stop_codon:yes gene_type:complete